MRIPVLNFYLNSSLMKRSTFLLIAALVLLAYGLAMIFAPGLLLDNILMAQAPSQSHTVARWLGFGVLSLGIINFLARNDRDSHSLKAILIGNLVFHLLGLFFDTNDYFNGVVSLSGLISGLVPHALLIMGFVYYLLKWPKAKL